MSAFCDTQNLELLDRQTDRQHGQCQKKTSEENKKKKKLKNTWICCIHSCFCSDL